MNVGYVAKKTAQNKKGRTTFIIMKQQGEVQVGIATLVSQGMRFGQKVIEPSS
jgi:hypothetical protein